MMHRRKFIAGALAALSGFFVKPVAAKDTVVFGIDLASDANPLGALVTYRYDAKRRTIVMQSFRIISRETFVTWEDTKVRVTGVVLAK